MNKKQQSVYDRTIKLIRDRLGSPHTIAVLSYDITGSTVTGETVRGWFADRRIPTDFAFVLYELMDREIDPLVLAPGLAQWVELKKAAPKSG